MTSHPLYYILFIRRQSLGAAAQKGLHKYMNTRRWGGHTSALAFGMKSILLTRYALQSSTNLEPSTSLQPNINSLSPSFWFTGLLTLSQKYHLFAISWPWHTFSLPGTQPTSHLVKPSSAFKSELQSQFLMRVFSVYPSKAEASLTYFLS